MLNHRILASGYAPMTWTYNANAADTSNATSYTFSGISIGDESPSRIVVVGVHTRGGLFSDVIDDVTLGGVSMTQAVTARDTTANFLSETAFYYLPVSSGTTSTIVVSTPGANLSTGIGVWSIYNARNSTPSNTSSDSDSNGVITLSLNTDADSVTFVLVGNQDETATNTAVGWTENFDVNNGETVTRGGYAEDSSAQSPRTITSTESVSAYLAGVAINWS